jgi:hypothetical protein
MSSLKNPRLQSGSINKFILEILFWALAIATGGTFALIVAAALIG